MAKKRIYLLLCMVLSLLIAASVTYASADDSPHAESGLIYKNRFIDDFNDNCLNSAVWTEYMNPKWGGIGLGIWEENQEIKFGIDGGATNIRSSQIPVGSDWDQINVSGVWKAQPTGTGVFQIVVFKGDPASGNYALVQYDDYQKNLQFYDSGTLITTLANKFAPTSYVPFTLTITRAGWSYEENGALIYSVSSTTFSDASNLALRIGGWDGSHGPLELLWFDEIRVDTVHTAQAPAPEEIPEFSTIAIPIAGIFGLLFLFNHYRIQEE